MAQTHHVYQFPVSKEDSARAVSDQRVHSGFLEHAIDFAVPIGTPIFAALDGEVIDIKQDSDRGGNDPKYVPDTNYVSIDHGDGELSEYMHLKKDSVLVKPGDKVCTGQKIALSGNTGYSTEPHLHFHVAKIVNAAPGWETLQVKFKEDLKIYRP